MKKTLFISLVSVVFALSFLNEANASLRILDWAEQRCSFAISMNDVRGNLLCSRQSTLCLVEAINAAGTNNEISGCIATLLRTSDPLYSPPVPTELLDSASDVIVHGKCTTSSAIELLLLRPIHRAGGLSLLETFKYTSASTQNRQARIIVDKIGATNAITRIAALFGTSLSQGTRVSD